MKKVNDATKLPEGILSVQLFVPDMFGNDILLTRQEHIPCVRVDPVASELYLVARMTWVTIVRKVQQESLALSPGQQKYIATAVGSVGMVHTVGVSVV